MENKRRFSASIIEARAGLIPESDDIADEKSARISRTQGIIRTIDRYTALELYRSKHRAVAAALADLRHYCDDNGMVFRDADREGRELYMEERNLEARLTW